LNKKVAVAVADELVDEAVEDAVGVVDVGSGLK
jgi:hypothetical protein